MSKTLGSLLALGVATSVSAVASSGNMHPICMQSQCTGQFDLDNCIIDDEKLMDKGAAVRFKNMAMKPAGEFYAGAGDLGDAQCRDGQKYITYDFNGEAMPFSIQFTPSDEKMVAYMTTSTHTKTWEKQIDDLRADPGCQTDGNTLSGKAVPPSQWNGITFTIANRDRNNQNNSGDIWITDVEVNGVKLGNFCGAASSGFNFQNYLPDYDMSAIPTTITGNLVLCSPKATYNKNEYDKFEVLFLQSDTTRAAEGCSTPTPTNTCPDEQVKLASVDGERTKSLAGLNDLPVKVLEADGKTVKFEVCNTLAGGAVWTSFDQRFRYQCMEHLQSEPNTNCQTYTASCRMDEHSIVDVYVANNGLDLAPASDVPRCCESESSPKVTQLTFLVQCFCPSDDTARNLLRGAV